MLYDFYSDRDGSFIKAYLRQNPQELQKLEKVASINEEWPPYSEVQNEGFADPVNRVFPIFSKTAAQTSALYAKAQIDEVPYEVKKRIQEACDLFGLDEDLINFQKVASTDVELLPSDFIFPQKRKLPVVDEDTFYMSQDVFLKVANELSFDDVVTGARRLVKKAMELGIADIDDDVKKLTLQRAYVDLNKVAEISRDRYLQTGDDRYMNIEKTASHNEFYALKNLIDLDRANGIDNTKDTILKVAFMKRDDIIRLGQLDVPVDKIASIPEDEWKEVLPLEEIAFFTEDGFNKEAFEQLYHSMTPVEQDIVNGFIQKYL